MFSVPAPATDRAARAARPAPAPAPASAGRSAQAPHGLTRGAHTGLCRWESAGEKQVRVSQQAVCPCVREDRSVTRWAVRVSGVTARATVSEALREL